MLYNVAPIENIIDKFDQVISSRAFGTTYKPSIMLSLFWSICARWIGIQTQIECVASDDNEWNPITNRLTTNMVQDLEKQAMNLEGLIVWTWLEANADLRPNCTLDGITEFVENFTRPETRHTDQDLLLADVKQLVQYMEVDEATAKEIIEEDERELAEMRQMRASATARFANSIAHRLSATLNKVEEVQAVEVVDAQLALNMLDKIATKCEQYTTNIMKQFRRTRNQIARKQMAGNKKLLDDIMHSAYVEWEKLSNELEATPNGDPRDGNFDPMDASR